jgi:osmotically-inducible protein OsmY
MNRKHLSLVAVVLLMVPFLGACATSTGINEIDDATLEAAVRAAISDDVPNEATEIGVSVDKGVVTLSGRVTRSEERTKIYNEARGVNGVRSVINNITVGPETGGI